MATEIVTLQVKDDFTAEAWEKALEMLKPPQAPPGLQTVRWGRAIGEVNTVIWILNWDTVAHQEAFLKAPVYPTFFSKIISFCVAPGFWYHSHLKPFPPVNVFDAGVVEVAAFTKKPDMSYEQFEAALDELLELVTSASGYQSHSIGTKHQDPEVYVGLFGWDSVEAANQVQLVSLVDSMIVPEKSSFTHVKLHPQ